MGVINCCGHEISLAPREPELQLRLPSTGSFLTTPLETCVDLPEPSPVLPHEHSPIPLISPAFVPAIFVLPPIDKSPTPVAATNESKDKEVPFSLAKPEEEQTKMLKRMRYQSVKNVTAAKVRSPHKKMSQDVSSRKIQPELFSRVTMGKPAGKGIKIEPSQFRTEKLSPFAEKYEELYVLGKGSFGVVKKVKDRLTGAIRAAKVISKECCRKGINYQEEINILKCLVRSLTFIPS